jgi:hypothetical protein
MNRGHIMAYMDLNQAFSGGVPLSAIEPVAAPTETGFSGIEWSVIALAARDKLSSLTEPGRVSRALGGLFGLGSTSRLADPRLEALRQMAVQAWHHGYLLPASEIGRFIAAGFNLDQFETLLASVAPRRSTRRQRIAA